MSVSSRREDYARESQTVSTGMLAKLEKEFESEIDMNCAHGMSSMAPLLFGVLRELGTLRLLSFWSVTGRT